MKRRYSDNKQSKVDFVVRKDSKFFLTFLFFAIGYSAVFALLYLCDATKILAISVELFGLCAFVGCIFYRERHWGKSVNESDFRCAIFANALTYGTEFCFIVNSRGEIIYADRRFQERFKNSANLKDLKSVLKIGNIKTDDISRFYYALDKRTGNRAYFTIFDNDANINLLLDMDHMCIGGINAMNASKTWNVVLNPLARPQNYFVVKATKITKEQVYESLMTEHGVGMYVANASGKIVFANDAFVSMMEIQNYESGYFSISDFSCKSMEAEDDSSFRAATGVTVPVKKTTACFVDTHDHQYTIGLVSPRRFSDINYHKHPCFMDAPIAVVQCDGNGKFIKINKLFSKFFSWAPISIEDVIDEEQKAIDIKAYLKSSSIQDMTIDTHILRTDKEFRVYLSKFLTSAGFFAICYFIDATENKDLKMKLEHSQRMHAVGQLAGGVAHDFNNILTAIMGHCDLLLEDIQANNPAYSDLQQIKVNAVRASNLTKQLLAFSRKQTLKLDVINVVSVIEGLSLMIRRIIGENIRYDFLTCSSEHVLIYADKGQLEQVIINLVVNAYHAMEKGGNLKIKVSTLKVDPLTEFPEAAFFPDGERVENGEYITVNVIDEGVGIPQDIMYKIFDPFFSTKEQGSGTGLGLSMVYGIVKQSGGYIFAESKQGTGSVFTILFPRIRGEQVTNSISSIANEPDGIIDEKGLAANVSVLLIEDESAVRSFVKRALEKEGYSVIDVCCGDDAIAISDSPAKFDVVISDVVMPGLSGPEVIEKIIERRPDVKVVFISGYAEEVFANYRKSLVENAHMLQKPFNIKALVAKIKEVFVS